MTDQPQEQPVDDVLQADVPGAQDSDYVTLALAHPLNAEDLQRLGIEATDSDGNLVITRPGSKISVYRDHARNLITAGYAQVDVEDAAAVERVLAGDSADAEQPPDSPDGQNTNVTRREPTLKPEDSAAKTTPGQTTPGEGTDRDVRPAAAGKAQQQQG